MDIRTPLSELPLNEHGQLVGGYRKVEYHGAAAIEASFGYGHTDYVLDGDLTGYEPTNATKGIIDLRYLPPRTPITATRTPSPTTTRTGASSRTPTRTSTATRTTTVVPDRRKVLVDEAHGEFISIEGNYAAIVEQLRASGYTVDRTTTAPLTAQTLQGYSVFVIGTPWSSFTVAEIDAVEQFINAGGGLLLTGLGWSWVNPSMGRTLENYPPNVIGRRFGVRFLDDVICDPAGHYGSDSCSPLFLPHVSHSLVEGVAALGGPISPAPISITHDLVYPVLTAGPFGFSNLGHYPPGTYPPVVVVASPGQGRVLAIGHEGYFATNDYDNNGIPNLYDYDNLQFAMNAFRWLAGQSTTQTPTTTPTSTPVATTTPGPWTYWLRLPLVVVEW